MPESRIQTALFALLGLNRAGKILYTVLFVAALPAIFVWSDWLPRYRFSEADERMFKAARHGDLSALEQAIAAGGGVNDVSPIDGKTALFRAAVFGRADAVRLLLERGASPAMRGSDGRTASEVVAAAMAEEKNPDLARALDAVSSTLQGAEEER